MSDEIGGDGKVSGPPGEPRAAGWERELVVRLASESLREQRRARRWGLVFRFALLAYLIALPLLYLPWGQWSIGAGPHSAVVAVDGLISRNTKSSAEAINAGLRAAFADPDTRGVILRINSPGGSAVQAQLVNDEIRRLRGKYPKIPLYAVIEEMGASGGYYLAVAADRIYASPASIVGSIGVLMNGFGFVGALDKLGIERRLYTAGERKGFLDPFSPARSEDVDHLRAMLERIHAQFIAAVKRGRGERLGDDPRLFSGLVWSGEEAVELGLVDALGSATMVAREVIGAARMVDFTERPGLLERLAERIGVQLGSGLASALGTPLLR